MRDPRSQSSKKRMTLSARSLAALTITLDEWRRECSRDAQVHSEGSLQIPFKIEFVAGKTARQIKRPVAKPDKLSSILKTHTVEERTAKWSRLPCAVACLPAGSEVLIPTEDGQHVPAQFLKLY